MHTILKPSLLAAGMALALIPLGSAQASDSRHGLSLIFDLGHYDYGHHYHRPHGLSYSYSYSSHRPWHHDHGHHYGHSNHYDSCSIHYRGKHKRHKRHHRGKKHGHHDD